MIIIKQIIQAINNNSFNLSNKIKGYKYNRAKQNILYFFKLINQNIPDIQYVNNKNISLKIRIK